MVLLGTIINGLAIIAGTMMGKVLTKIPENIKTTVMQGIALSVIVIGLQMSLASEQFLVVIGSLVLGAILGEKWNLDGKLNALGEWLEKKVGANEKGSVAKGFVTATLIFVIGALAIVGSLDSGLRGDHTVLYTKSLIDGFTSLFLTTTLGIGVIFSAIPVMLYQGLIALFAVQIEKIVPEVIMSSFIKEMTGAGGVMIMAIGLNLLGVTKIRVANLLPAILVVACIVTAIFFANQSIIPFMSSF
jgi:uncharacterized protein